MCLAGDVVTSWSLMQEVVGLTLFTIMTNVFVAEFAEFIENIESSIVYTAYQVRSVYPIFIKPMEIIEIKN